MKFYFAFGSNMLRSRLETERVGQVIDLGIATLEGYKIAFNKLSKKDGTGKTNIISSPVSQVVGVIYNLTEEQFIKLDSIEGVGYVRTLVSVKYNNEVVPAYTYIATDNAIDDSLKPKQEYLQHLIDGAKEHSFPKQYVLFLESIECL
jgi:gamma-glutamylcyclotransferase